MTTIDGVKYDSTGKFVITGSVLSSLPADLTIRNTVKNDVNGNPIFVIQINDNALLNATNITQLSFGSSMSLIGNSAFQGCTMVTNINFGTGLRHIWQYAFRRQDRLREVKLNEGILTLQNACFANCTSITYFNLPSTLASIANGAFYASPNVQTISMGCNPSNIVSIVTDMILDAQPVGSCKVKLLIANYATIGNTPLLYKTCLETLVIRENVISVLNSSLSDSTKLKTVDASNAFKLVRIMSDNFKNCSNLSELKFFNGLTTIVSVITIGAFGFGTKETKTSITPTIGLTDIFANAFLNCSKLTRIDFPATLKTLYGTCFENCTGLTEINFIYEDSIKVMIGSNLNGTGGAFKGCINIKSLNLHWSINSVANDAFSNCKGITNIRMDFFYTNLSEIITAMSLTGLKFLHLYNPSIPVINYGNKILEELRLFAVTAIASNAFSSQSLLRYIYIEGNDPANGIINSIAFKGCSGLTDLNLFRIKRLEVAVFQNCYSLPKFNYDKNLEVINSSAFNSCTNLTEVNCYDEVNSNLTLIGDSAFFGCTKLQYFPPFSKVKYIEGNAFGNCTSLTSITLYPSFISVDNLAFASCTGIKTLSALKYFGNLSTVVSSMPLEYISFNYAAPVEALNKKTSLKNVDFRNINSIGSAAFYQHTLIESIFMPPSCTYIANSGFHGCTGLTLFFLSSDSQLIYIGENAFNSCAKLTTFTFYVELLTIDNYAFQGCIGLTEILMNSTKLIKIAYASFDSCTSLRSISVPKSVTEIGAFAFNNCRGLTTATIPIDSSLKQIGDYAFHGCTKLTGTIVIPNSLTRIGAFAFYYDVSLNEIELVYNPANQFTLSEIGESAFEGCGLLQTFLFTRFFQKLGPRAFRKCIGLTKIQMGSTTQNNLKTIGSYAFLDCSSLTELIITRTETMTGIAEENITIESGAFGEAKALKKITLIDTVKRIFIGNLNQIDGTFQGCSGLTSIIMNGVERIFENSFKVCIGLTSLTLPSTVLTIASSAFTGCSNITQLEVNSYLSNLSAVVDPMNLTDLSLNNVSRVDLLDTSNNKTTLKNVEITGITFLQSGAFKDITALQNVSINGTNVILGASGNVPGAFQGCTGLTRIIMFNILTIWNNAFSRCTSLTSIRLGNSVTYVHNSAFTDCSNITQLEVNSYLSNLYSIVAPMNLTDLSLNNVASVDVLDNKITLKNVEITGISFIASGAFKDITALQNASINGTNVILGHSGNVPGAFQGCTGLTRIIMSNIRTIWNNAFVNCTGLTSVTLPSTVVYVHDSAFYGCTNITDFKVNSYLNNFYDIVRDMSLNTLDLSYNGALPRIQIQKLEYVRLNGITAIDDSAFALCIGLTNIILSPQLRNIGNNLFYGCKKLSEITLPATSLTSIGTQAFQDCFSLKEFSIPASVNTLGNKIFQGCSGLTKITINKTNPNLAYALYGLDNAGLEVDFSFNGNIPNGALYNKSGITQVTIRNTIQNIGKSVFEGCNGLTSIIFSTPNSTLSLLDNKAFANCINLQEITIPSNVTQIGDYTFLNCTSLKTVIIPASVKTIGMYAFSGCSGLTGVSIVNTNSALVQIGDFAFNNCINLETISLPSNFRIVNKSVFEENVFEGCVKLTKY